MLFNQYPPTVENLFFYATLQTAANPERK